VYFLYELCDKDVITLLEEDPRGMFTESAARVFCTQIASALRHCHSLGIYHMDVKPENVLVIGDSTFKITDFGCAYAPAPSVTHHHLEAATPGYGAPELFPRGVPIHSCNIGKSDVWALGFTLLRAVTQVMPWDTAHCSDAGYAYWKRCHRNGDMNALRDIIRFYGADVSGSFCNLVIRMLDPNPETRASMQAVLDHAWLHQ
jgi:serine/threonine protein kinase